MSADTSTDGANTPLGHPRVCYVTSEDARAAADALPSNKGRSSLVHSLIESLDLLDYGEELDDSRDSDSSAQCVPKTPANALRKARVIETPRATRSELCRFHDKHYVDALFEASAQLLPGDIGTPDTSFESETCTSPSKRQRIAEKNDEEDDHGLEHDCPVFAELEDYCSFVAGGSLAAARALRQQEADIAIHWDGGRHHATKAGAAGFCYVNDIVLAILELQRSPTPARNPASGPLKRLKKVLYIDLDLHHGDGVADAFEHNANVVTVSLHLWSRGFYPSTPKGHLDYSGPAAPSPAAGTALNIAVPGSGLSDASFLRLVNNCIKPIFEAFGPDAVVMQCGLDGLAGDPCGEFNLSLRGYGRVVETVLTWCRRGKAGSSAQSNPTEAAVANSQGSGMIPVFLLGGGGYHSTNAARAWAYITSIALGRPLDLVSPRIPEDCNSWSTFVRDGSAGDALDIAAHVAKRDENTQEDLERIEAAFVEHVRILNPRKGKT